MPNFPIMPPQGSDYARQVDYLFWTITALTVFFTVVVGLASLVLAIRYRASKRIDRSNAPHHNLKLEIVWSIIPLVLALVIFAWGAIQFVDAHTPPKDAMEVFVVGKQWMWHIQHSNGVRENNALHVPVNRAVKLTMISQDVLHAFYIPAFRAQYHVVPGRYTSIWFKPNKTGKYNMWCAMHCGSLHSEMGGYVYVLPEAEFEAWLANGGENPPATVRTLAEKGGDLYEKLACGTCHGPQDTPRGPSLITLLGRKRTFTDGTSAIADEKYIRESIVNPYARLTQGYESTMPEYKEQLSEEQLLQLIAYIKTLGTAQPAATATPTDPGAQR